VPGTDFYPLMKDLHALRRKIDTLDERIVDLLNRRAEVVGKIGRLKEREGVSVYSPERESEVLKRVERRNGGPLTNECLRSVYRELMSGSLSIEKSVRVAFLGPPGTFAHIAARKKFGNSVEYRPARDLASVFEMVARGAADYGIVPCENSFGSGISLSLDLFTKHEVKICAEIYLSIRLSLLSKAAIEDVRVVYSHPHAFQQCQSWLRNNFGAAVDLIEVASTTLAAEKASKVPRAAAVASAEVARRYGLRVIQSDIGDDSNAFTRFFVLSRDFGGASGSDRTSIVLAAEDRVGSLHEILGTFRRQGLSLTKIESRMGPHRPRDAHFFIDFLGHCADPKVKRALRSVAQLCRFLTVLGSYPAEE